MPKLVFFRLFVAVLSLTDISVSHLYAHFHSRDVIDLKIVKHCNVDGLPLLKTQIEIQYGDPGPEVKRIIDGIVQQGGWKTVKFKLATCASISSVMLVYPTDKNVAILIFNQAALELKDKYRDPLNLKSAILISHAFAHLVQGETNKADTVMRVFRAHRMELMADEFSGKVAGHICFENHSRVPTPTVGEIIRMSRSMYGSCRLTAMFPWYFERSHFIAAGYIRQFGDEYQVERGKSSKFLISGYSHFLQQDYIGAWKGGITKGNPVRFGVGNLTKGTWAMGSRKGGVMEGYGSLEYEYVSKSALPRKYMGNLEVSTPDGTGVMYYCNGDWYEGHWSSGKKHGAGLFHYASGKIRRCLFEEDKLVWESDFITDTEGHSNIWLWKDGRYTGLF